MKITLLSMLASFNARDQTNHCNHSPRPSRSHVERALEDREYRRHQQERYESLPHPPRTPKLSPHHGYCHLTIHDSAGIQTRYPPRKSCGFRIRLVLIQDARYSGIQVQLARALVTSLSNQPLVWHKNRRLDTRFRRSFS